MKRSSNVIPLRAETPTPVEDTTCFMCVNGYMGVNGVICEITRDFVFDDNTAASCEAFERE